MKLLKQITELLAYKAQPTEKQAQALEEEFIQLFSTQTGYQQLDERIQKTKLKKNSLLLVLKHPALPLHNNGAELGTRAQEHKRVIEILVFIP